MSSWPQVREELLRLLDLEPRVLTGYTGPDTQPEPAPPFTIRLTSSSVSIAEDLYRSFRTEVTLRVGALPYPPAADESSLDPYGPMLREAVSLDHSLDGLLVELDGALEVRSGQAVTHGLLITNQRSAPISVHTNGQLTAQIVDPADGSHVGGASGFQRMPRVSFAVDPGATTRIPLLVGTDSYVPRLGYTIPPGSWGLTTDLDIGDSKKLRTPLLAFEVIS